MKNNNILVSGAAGNSGTLIVQALAAQQIPVRALVRDTAKAQQVANLPGVDLYTGDMAVRETLKAVLEGVERVLLISGANDRMVETQCTFIDACKQAGVHHVIKFSGEESQQGYDPQRFRYTREHEQIEDYLERSGLQWTHLRPSQFMQVYLREAAAMRESGELRLPLEKISMSPVDLRDVAKIAAALLIEGGHYGESLRVTGPAALSMADIAGIVSSVTDKPIRYVPVSWNERKTTLSSAGLPPYFIDALAEQAAERIRNPKAFVDNHTHQLFGITPTSFEQFAAQHNHIFN
ncbi:NAD(P)-dependent oxidoreductase [Niastella yeongjuensis]|uniref:NAD(P)-dependent oxidoreductase n=1 Tax=Niastella yeongjuensis TaxID=354355 RepID=A0A1V9E1L3_9BACT|nr:SDR family oxidoreductase [Niastella yeongjuensis]OQP40017.1 NAD(P)-dependent oxidoreductase [Niastella yeongjuensis]